jgi:site-specific DNA-methyltransferase (adenine-specific)
MLKLLHGDCLDLMKELDNDSIDLTVTSPPYDNLRTYNGFTFDFEGIATELYRITKPGGVIVWIVGDATINGSETGTSFKQALYFKDIGFNLHDTMIWNKGTFTAVGALVNKYAPVFEYMFILSKGNPKTFNPIKDRPNKSFGEKKRGTFRQKDGTTKPLSSIGKLIAEYGQRFNIWEQPSEKSKHNRFHPAMFPEQLAHDHITSWSNEGDTVLDCFMGSGTTGKMAKQLNRNFIGMEISQEYLDIATVRINA